MAVPTSVLWDRDPHTAAKHDLLRRYLMAWFPILATGFPGQALTYVDAFAGPGEYACGSEGSPLIALRQALRQEVISQVSQANLIFIEENQARHAHLDTVVERVFPSASRPKNVRIFSHPGDCKALIDPALTEARAWDTPMFVNLDGWGTDTPYTVLQKLGRQDRCEVLITFARGWPIRTATRVDDPLQLDTFFGEPKWREVAAEGTPAEKKRNLIDYYAERLRRAGFPYPLAFELIDEGGHELLLVYGTKHERGVSRMKDAMWTVDKINGQRFRDPKDLDQLVLPIEEKPDLTLLRKQLLARVVETGGQTLEELKRFALLETMYKPSHVTRAVSELEVEMKLGVERRRSHADTVVSPTLLSGI